MAKKKMNFEESLERLEEIQNIINGEDSSIDDTMKLFEEGVKLTRMLEKELDAVEARIEVLVNVTEEDGPQFEDFEQ